MLFPTLLFIIKRACNKKINYANNILMQKYKILLLCNKSIIIQIIFQTGLNITRICFENIKPLLTRSKRDSDVRGGTRSLNERSWPQNPVGLSSLFYLAEGGRPGFPGSSVPFSNCATPRWSPPSRGKWIIDGTKQWRSFVRRAPARNMCSTHRARLSIRQFCTSRVAPGISRTSGPSYRVESSIVRYIWLSDRCLLKIIRNYNRPQHPICCV